MEGMEQTCFEMISAAGAARSCFIEAMQSAREGDFEAAAAQIKDGKDFQIQAHQIHHELLTKEANGQKADVDLLLVHAEDQLMSAETFGILADEWVELYGLLKGGKKDDLD